MSASGHRPVFFISGRTNPSGDNQAGASGELPEAAAQAGRRLDSTGAEGYLCITYLHEFPKTPFSGRAIVHLLIVTNSCPVEKSDMSSVNVDMTSADQVAFAVSLGTIPLGPPTKKSAGFTVLSSHGQQMQIHLAGHVI